MDFPTNDQRTNAASRDVKRNQFEFLSGRAGKRSDWGGRINTAVKRDQGRVAKLPFNNPWFIPYGEDMTPKRSPVELIPSGGKNQLECGRVAMVGPYFMCKVDP